MKCVFVCVMLLVLSPLLAMNDLKQEVQWHLQNNKDVEYAALATWEPKHYQLDCCESLFITGVKVGYNLLPFAPTVLSGIILTGIMGDPRFMMGGLFMLYPLGYFNWTSHIEKASVLSNKAARHFVSEDYQKHLKKCTQIAEEFKEKQEEDTYYKKFCNQIKAKAKKEKEEERKRQFKAWRNENTEK